MALPVGEKVVVYEADKDKVRDKAAVTEELAVMLAVQEKDEV